MDHPERHDKRVKGTAQWHSVQFVQATFYFSNEWQHNNKNQKNKVQIRTIHNGSVIVRISNYCVC